MSQIPPLIFLIDVDNTLLDGDRLVADWKSHLHQSLGAESARQYWDLFDSLRTELGYVDYLGALQQFRQANPLDQKCLHAAAFLLDYPFANILLTGALDVITHLSVLGPVVILSDGDVVYQPRKIERSGIFAAVDGRVLVYIHKERALDDIEKRFPAQHYVMVDDKPRILTAMKNAWGNKLTTVFARQGHYARHPEVPTEYSPADIQIEHIGDLLNYTQTNFAAGKTVGVV